MMRQFPHYKKHQRGVGIIEVLVALVVVSLGVLGMANLQLTGIKHSNSGYNRAKALMVACLLYTSPSPRDKRQSRMPSSA